MTFKSCAKISSKAYKPTPRPATAHHVTHMPVQQRPIQKSLNLKKENQLRPLPHMAITRKLTAPPSPNASLCTRRNSKVSLVVHKTNDEDARRRTWDTGRDGTQPAAEAKPWAQTGQIVWSIYGYGYGWLAMVMTLSIMAKMMTNNSCYCCCYFC